MADLQLNSEGDLDIVNNELVIAEDADAIVQHLTIRLRFFLGEWFLDQRLGIPYFDDVLIKNPDLVAVRGILRRAILDTPGVESLDKFEFDFDAAERRMRLDFTVRRTDDGTLLDFSREFILT